MLNFFLTRTSGFGVAVGIILIANNWGRVKSLVLSHTLLGISCICLAFIPKTSINAILVVYIFANIVASISKYYHCRKNGSNLFQTTADAHPGVSGVSKDQKFCEKFKNTHCQVDHPAKIE